MILFIANYNLYFKFIAKTASIAYEPMLAHVYFIQFGASFSEHIHIANGKNDCKFPQGSALFNREF